jgi:hypothetical protein
MKERLEWILAQLVKLDANGQIRYEGNSLYQAAKQELESIIAGWVDALPPPPPINYQAFAPGELDALIEGAALRISGSIQEAATHAGDVALGAVANDMRLAIAEEVEKSDVAVLAALADTRAELLAALAPAA